MAIKSLYLIAFDIVENRTRYRCVKQLLNYGQRVQKSVFECILNDAQFLELKNKLDNLINPECDSLRYYLLCKNCAQNILVTGLGQFTSDEELIII
jgi:CRISPR-associated protein Cas2